MTTASVEDGRAGRLARSIVASVVQRKRSPLEVTRPGVVVPVRCDPESGLTWEVLQGAAWRRSSHGLHVPASVDPHRPAQRVVEAAATLPGYGGVTGWAALNWAGGHWFDGMTRDGDQRDIWLATGSHDIRPQPGTKVSAERLPPDHLTVVDGLPMTLPVRSVLFEMRYAGDVREAAVHLSLAAYSDLVSLAEARDHARQLNTWTGIPQAREATELAEENAWSPQEMRLHLAWRLDAGLPRLLCNVPIFDRDGRHVGTPDLLDPVAGLVVDYDSQLHITRGQRRIDRDREERYRGHGLEVLIALPGDLVDRPRLAERMHESRRAALVGRGVSRREWTLQQPPWWIDTSTVERRRALSAYDRGRLLRYRNLAG